MSLVNQEVVIDLGGAVYELRPTLKAMKKIQARFGGLAGAAEALKQLNSEHIAAIVSAGSNAAPRDIADIEEAVFSQGIASATEQVVPYITLLLNPGGEDEASSDEAKKK